MSTTKNSKKKCYYKHLKNITKTINGKECSAFERLTITCTVEELIAQYVCDVLAMRQHDFHLEWQRLQFGNLIKNLKAGEVIMVIDLAKELLTPVYRRATKCTLGSYVVNYAPSCSVLQMAIQGHRYK